MRNVQIVPEDIVVLAEFRISEIKMLREAMNNVTISMEIADPEQKKIHDFFTIHFMEWLDGTLEAVEHG